MPYLHQYDNRVIEDIENLKRLLQTRQDRIPTENKLKLRPEHVISFEDLALGDKIGGGGFGDVHVALWKGNQVAVKKLRVQRVSQRRKKEFEDEVRAFSNLSHPNIVQFYGACIVPPNLAIVMELMPDGSLYDNLHYSETAQFGDDVKDRFILDSFMALTYLHQNNFVHRDIKSKNIMLFDERTRCKLADFGLALKDDTESNASQRDHGFAGTEKYCPKEVLDGARLTVEQLKAVDVYSLALTMVELLTEKEPFDHLRNVHQIRKAIQDGEQQSLDGYGIPANKQFLLKQALSTTASQRPPASSFLMQFKRIVEAN